MNNLNPIAPARRPRVAAIECPFCKGVTEVKDSRPAYGNQIRRRRKCVDCGYKATSYEILVEDAQIIKGAPMIRKALRATQVLQEHLTLIATLFASEEDPSTEETP